MKKKTIWLLLLLSIITIGTILTYFTGHSALNYQRNESLMDRGAFKIEALVTDIYQTKGRSTHTWYYEYVYMVDGTEYLDRDMLEYNPVSIGDTVAIYVADDDHSVNRVAKFWEKRSR